MKSILNLWRFTSNQNTAVSSCAGGWPVRAKSYKHQVVKRKKRAEHRLVPILLILRQNSNCQNFIVRNVLHCSTQLWMDYNQTWYHINIFWLADIFGKKSAIGSGVHISDIWGLNSYGPILTTFRPEMAYHMDIWSNFYIDLLIGGI